MITLLEVTSAGVAFTATLNGIPVHAGAEPIHSGSAKIDIWARPGTNRLALTIGRPEQTTGREEAPIPRARAPFLRLVVRMTLSGPDTSADQVLATYEWSPTSGQLSPNQVPVFQQDVELGPRPFWRWLGAFPHGGLSQRDEAAIIATVRSLRDALAARDSRRVIAIQDLSLREQAIALGVLEDEMLGDYAEFLEERFADQDWSVPPLNLEALRFNSLADGKITHLCHRDGSPVLTTNSKQGIFAIDPFLADLNGAWIIVR